MNIVEYDVKTLVGLLVWGNITCVALICSYLYCIKDAGDKELAKSVIAAKSLLAAGFLFILYRGSFPDFVSVNLGNSLAVLGCFFEGRSILTICGARKSATMKLIMVLTLIVIVCLNASTYIFPDTLHRNAIGSLGIFVVLVAPVCMLLFSKSSTAFKRIVGLFYLLNIVLLLPRGLYFLAQPDVEVFSQASVQGMTFTAILLLTIFSLSAFLMLMKEEADKKLQKLAHTDSLTGLNNRQSFFDIVTPAFERHRRAKTPCSFLFMDIDHFKKVNDTYGHAFGDEVLKTAAAILTATVRGYDIPSRFGGEEFAAFIDDSDPDAGNAVAERIRSRMKQAVFSENPDFRFSISVGVATGVPREGDTIDKFIEVADEALYEAKNTGRDKVVERQMSAQPHVESKPA